MKALQRIWADVRRGENIDLYLTVIVVFGLGILNIVGSASSVWTTSAILAALGILAISALRSEHRAEELSKKLAQSADTFFLEDFPTAALNDEFATANELWLAGVTLSRTIKSHYSEIKRKLERGDVIKVLLVHPEGPAIEVAETRVFDRPDLEWTRMNIRGALRDLCHLQSAAPNKLEIRTIQNPLGFGAIAVNPDSSSGILYLEHYPFKTEGGSKPKFVLRAKDGRWYDFFKSELRTLWENGTEWKCDGTVPK